MPRRKARQKERNKKMKDAVVNYAKGEQFLATVKSVRQEGVYIKMPNGGAGVVSTRCFGSGEARRTALAKIRPGDKLMVKVVSWHPMSKTLSLILSGKALAKKMSHAPRAEFRRLSHKPSFKAIPPKTLLVVDTANLIGDIEPEHVAAMLEGTAATLHEAGYRTMFFLERGTLTWLMHHQASSEGEKRLDAFSRRDDVVLVGAKAEADLPILQTLESVPESCAISLDRFWDYKDAFPEIVDSARIRTFSLVRYGDKLNISIDGIRQMISVSLKGDEEAPVPEDEEKPVLLATKEATAPAAAQTPRSPTDAGVLGIGLRMMERGSVESAIRLISRAEKKNPAAYFALAEAYSQGNVGEPDQKAAAKFKRLGDKLARRQRQAERRYARKNAARRRDGYFSCPHLSARKIKAMGLADFARGHEEAAKYRSMHRRISGRAFGRAA